MMGHLQGHLLLDRYAEVVEREDELKEPSFATVQHFEGVK